MSNVCGLNFALRDDELRPIVPPGLEGTAQAIYGTVGIGAATALLRPELGWPGY
jgi:hypothetical protein